MNTKTHAKVPHPHRWYIELEWETQSPLILQDGEAQEEERTNSSSGEKEITLINTLATDHEGYPYLPATSLKGILRQAAHQRWGSNEAICQLFGGTPETDERQGGMVEFRSAMLSQTSILNARDDGLPKEDEKHLTFTETSTVINPHTLTTEERKLFTNRIAKAGLVFKSTCILQAKADEKEQAKHLIAMLHQLASKNLHLGGDTGRGYGEIALSIKTIKYFGEKEMQKWINARKVESKIAWFDSATEEKNAHQLDVPKTNDLEFKFNLQFTGLFMVHEPERKVSNDANTLKARLDAKGKPVLPSKTLHGALRAQSRRILNTLGLQNEREMLLNALYGGVSSASALTQVYQPKIKNTPIEHTQNFVAIDRFTGGGRDGALYAAQAFYKPHYEVCFRLNLNRLKAIFNKQVMLTNKQVRLTNEQEKLINEQVQAVHALWLLTLRDLRDGDIRMGWGKAKGYGECKAIDLKLDQLPKLLQNLKRLISKKYQPLDLKTMKSLPSKKETIKSHYIKSDHDKFHNTYYFIPLQKESNIPQWVEKSKWRDDVLANNHHDSHDGYWTQQQNHEPVFHGEITCQITSTTPFIIGGSTEKQGDESIIHPYQIPSKPSAKHQPQLVLPATSLKGMVSSIHEVMTKSALRIFDTGHEPDKEKVISYRKPIEDALSAIGIVVERKNKNGQLSKHLVCLSSPTYAQNDAKNKSNVLDYGKLKLKYYFGSYKTDKKSLEKYHSFNEEALKNNQFFYLKKSLKQEYHTKTQQHQTYVIGQKAQNTIALPISHENYLSKPNEEKQQYVRGILRVLGNGHGIPSTKKHEIFIEFPKSMNSILDVEQKNNEQQNNDKVAIFPLSKQVIANFEAIAKARHAEDSKLPLAPKTQPPRQGVTKVLKGDLVFFKLKNKQVCEIAYSQIWRNLVLKDDNTPAYFVDFLPHKEFAPMHSKRTLISPSERLFGYIDTDKAQKNTAMMGKVIFNDAYSTQPITHQKKVTKLKILAEPKPPSPAMYFSHRNHPKAVFISKSKLNPREHIIKGYKRYVHALKNNPHTVTKYDAKGLISPNGQFPWESNHQNVNEKQRLSAYLVDSNCTFEYKIQFKNLTKHELSGLLYCLKPNSSFQHKLGLGKAIGLGSFLQNINQVTLVDRYSKYTNPSDTIAQNQLSEGQINQMIKDFREQAPKDQKAALHAIGDPTWVKYPVHVPQIKGKDIETETFKWFITNDQKMKQLPNLYDGDGTADYLQLPTLNSHA